MALNLWVSTSLQVLKEHLATRMNAAQWGVLQPIHIVTQTEGMNIWLQQQLAHSLGIAANIVFDKPNDIIYEIYKILQGGKQETFNRENLTWLIYEILGTSSFRKRYPVQASYFEFDASIAEDVKRLKLAEK